MKTKGMKLVSKNILINTVISIIILFLGEYSIFVLLKQEITKETTEHLSMERMVFLDGLQNGVSIEYYKNNIGDIIDITPIDHISFAEPVFQDLDESDHERREETFAAKKMTFDCTYRGQHYRVSITKTVDEDEGLARSLPTTIILSGVGMLVMLVLVNLYIYSKLFAPVNKLIRDIEQFSIHDLEQIVRPKTSTYEFYILGKKVSAMSQKIISDYKSMKEFTENMAHEVQTPLAVINSKLEHCIQDENLTASQAALLSDALQAVQKLFKLNRGLIILSKLENQQYSHSETINITQLVQERLAYFSDFLNNKNIKITEQYTHKIYANLDSSLSEVFIDNILKNAIQHNFDRGELIVTTEPNALLISNTGPEPKVSTEEFFNRFYSGNSNESLGLGLSIVKKICDYNGFKSSYYYENGFHHVKITFRNHVKNSGEEQA